LKFQDGCLNFILKAPKVTKMALGEIKFIKSDIQKRTKVVGDAFYLPYRCFAAIKAKCKCFDESREEVQSLKFKKKLITSALSTKA
jgi:hypothetical protein